MASFPGVVTTPGHSMRLNSPPAIYENSSPIGIGFSSESSLSPQSGMIRHFYLFIDMYIMDKVRSIYIIYIIDLYIRIIRSSFYVMFSREHSSGF